MSDTHKEWVNKKILLFIDAFEKKDPELKKGEMKKTEGRTIDLFCPDCNLIHRITIESVTPTSKSNKF